MKSRKYLSDSKGKIVLPVRKYNLLIQQSKQYLLQIHLTFEPFTTVLVFKCFK